LFEFAEVKGTLLIAQSRKDKKEEGLKIFFYPKGPQGNPKHKRFVAKGC